MGTLLEFSCPHPLEQVHILFHRTGSIGTVLARLGQRAAVMPDFLRAQTANVCLTNFDQLNGVFIELVKVVRCVVQMIAPIEPKPSNICLDRFHVFDFLLAWIGIIEPQVTCPALVFTGDAEVEADGFGVSNVEVTVGFRWKSGHDSTFVLVCLQILCDDTTNKVRCWGGTRGGHVCGSLLVLPAAVVLLPAGILAVFSS